MRHTLSNPFPKGAREKERGLGFSLFCPFSLYPQFRLLGFLIVQFPFAVLLLRLKRPQKHCKCNVFVVE